MKTSASHLPSLLARVGHGVIAVWGAVTGILPHVLHHVGPLAGTALVAGAGGRSVFAAIGFVAAVPFLLRLRRRFGTWPAPAIGLGLFIATFAISTLVIGPLISERSGPSNPPDRQEQPVDEHGHATGA